MSFQVLVMIALAASISRPYLRGITLG